MDFLRFTPTRRVLFVVALSSALVACTDESSALSSPSRFDSPRAAGDGDHDESGDGDDVSGDQFGDGDSDGAPLSASAPYYSEEPPPQVSASEVLISPFVNASTDPFSTFGADVDTASYDYFRQSMGLGVLPQPAHVRVEDFVNFFDYGYTAPALDAVEPFAINLAAGVHPLGRATQLLRVGIQAKAPPAEEVKPANLVFLVDVSGSMASELKLPLVKVVLKESLSRLAATDKVSIVTYAGDTRVRLAPTSVGQRATIEAVIDGLEAGGGTNGASGINLAYEQASAGFLQDGINHVILCTDGDFNLGITSEDALVALIRSKRDSGITLTALGFGRDNLNDAMMEKVSNAGNGSFSVIYSPDQAVEYANERLLATIVLVAKDMKIQVEFNPTLVLAYRLLGYENRAIADDDFRDDRVDAGEVGAGHRVTALYELVRVGEPIPMPVGAPVPSAGETSTLQAEIAAGELVRVKVRYKLPGATDAEPAAEVTVALTPEDLVADPALHEPDVSWAAAVAGFAEQLRDSPYASEAELARIGDIVELQKTQDSDRGEFVGLYAQARALLTAP